MIRLTAVIELEGHGPRALTHESNARQIVVGRDNSADFQVPLTTVSRQHVRIQETDNVYVIEDLGSTHGTLLNGKKLEKGEKKVLRDGDVLELTKAKITCNISADKVVEAEPNEATQAIAARAVEGILGRLGDATDEGPYFRVLVGPEEGQKLRLGGTTSEWTMGRSKDCEFVLNDPNVSRRHATVRKDWNGYTVEDLGSKNGVIVNEKRIGKARRLKDQDEVIVGPVKLLYIDPDAELMEALADVPGFESSEETEEPEAEAFGEDSSHLGAPDGDDDVEAPEGEIPPPIGDEAMPEEFLEEEEEEEDEFASIDPDLLEADERKFPTEWVIIGGVGFLILACVFLLVLVL